jgi:effector-binding domain-containing protein
MNRLVGLCLTCLVGTSLLAAEPSTKPATQPADCLVGEMRIQTLAQAHYVYATTQTTLATITDAITKLMPSLEKLITDGKVKPSGPVVLVYQGATGDPAQKFALEVGIVVAKDQQPVDDFKVRKLAAQKSATVLFTGAPRNIGKAWEKLMGSLFAAGHQPDGEMREYYLYWEGVESPNNVVLIQVGIR